MKALGFAAAFAAGALLAGPASAFVIVHEDVYQGGWSAPGNTLVDGATLYLRFESAAPVTAFTFDIFQYKSYDWYNADGSPQGYGNDNPDPIYLSWNLVNGAMEAAFTLPSAYRVGAEGDPYVLYYYQIRHFKVSYLSKPQDYYDVPWKLTYSDAPIASVPEPSSWALMIAGFGLAGAGLRSARRRRALAA